MISRAQRIGTCFAMMVVPGLGGVAGGWADDPTPVRHWPPPPAPLVADAHWGREPVEELTEKRGRIVLNGVWNLMPGMEETEAYQGSTWGRIRVPGSWIGGHERNIPYPSIVLQGTGPAWANRHWRQQIPPFGVWYARTIRVPERWRDRAVVLDISWVESFAEVYVDDVYCGRISRPFGSLDLTPAIRAGSEQRLMIRVHLRQPERTYTAMGIGFVREEGTVSYRAAGLLGDVVLLSRPAGPHISDVFVQPSVRRRSIRLDVELTGVQKAAEVDWVAEMYDEQDRLEIVLRGRTGVVAREVQRVLVDLPWENPRLWDYKQPNLYTLRLRVSGADLDDVYWQPFGFREIWIEGRKIMLNGKEIRLSMCGPYPGFASFVPELNDLAIDAMLERGHNLCELWPEHPYQTTRWVFHQEVAARCADRKGFFFTGVMSHAVHATGARRGPEAQKAWDEDPTVREAFRRETEQFIRRLRNHPSILMWGSTGNFGLHSQDQNPRYLGAPFEVFQKTSFDADQNRRFFEAWQIQKEVDPTRPIFWHASTIGDIHTLNWYLNFTPLQEREEWLSHWVIHGARPVTGVEFGLPYTYTFQRMRSYDGMGHWEILGTEHMADLLGEEAYRLEGDHMWRWALHPRIRIGGPEGPEFGPFMHHRHHLHHPDYRAYQVWYIPWVRNTWRSWRTWGIPITPLPWGEGRAEIYRGEPGARWRLPPWQPGRLGGWIPEVPLSALPKIPEDETRGRLEMTTRQRTLQENNQDTLAWIAGPESEFTAKDHSFWVGELLEKSLVVINDTRADQTYHFAVNVTLGGRILLQEVREGIVGSAESKFVPIRVALPVVGEKTEGEIRIQGFITTREGRREHQDVFLFRVFPRLDPPQWRVRLKLWDPVGKTADMLKALGYSWEPWGNGDGEGLWVIGREALSRGKGPADLTRLLRSGARVLVMSQDPDWTRSALDLRVAPRLARVVYPTMADHPVVSGLDDLDLRDWRGSSTLVDPYPHYPHEFRPPFYGWRWGNRGALSSGPIEQPHNAGWRPLLSCYFEQAWTPLMELDFGGGRLIWNAVDFEDFVPRDPAATKLLSNLLEYAAHAPLAPRVRVIVVGLDDAQQEIVRETSLVCETADELPEEPCIALLGRRARLPEAVIETFVRKGGRVVFWAPEDPEWAFGAVFKINPDAGKYSPLPPWPELRSMHGGYFRTRGPVKDYRVLAGGADIELAANGQLGRRVLGEGTVVWFMPAPDRLDLPPQPCIVDNRDLRHVRRFTRWNQHRALVRLLANLGAEFALDWGVPRLRSLSDSIALAGIWRVHPIELRPVNRDFRNRLPVTPPSNEVFRLVGPDVDDTEWEKVVLPGLWESFREQDGEAVFRRYVTIPEDWLGRDLRLTLGPIRDADTVFWNGVAVGSTQGHAQERVYIIPAILVREGLNLIAVRVVNNYLWGGFAADDPSQMALLPVDGQNRIGRAPFGPWRSTAYYHFDYSESDDPFRYWRW